MRNRLPIVALTAGLLLAPANAFAWGFTGHRLIVSRAIDLLPPELQPFFRRFKDEVVVRVVDPDLWRNVGGEDDPNHFVAFGLPALGSGPCGGSAPDYTKALARFGVAEMKRIGMLPWREEEMF